MAAAVCRGVVRVLVYWWRRGERAAIAAAVGVPWRFRGGGGATPARRHCWGGRGAAGVLRCWRGGGEASAGRRWRGEMTEASVCRCVFGAAAALPGRKGGGENEMRDD